MSTVYQNPNVDLKIVQVENGNNSFYQVWKDGVICKQSESLDNCSNYAFDLVEDMIKEKLSKLESNVYWAGESYLNCTDDFSHTCAREFTKAQLILKQFRETSL